MIANDLQGETGTPIEIGVIDSSIDNCSTGSPDFYARTDSFLAWADQLIANLARPVAPEPTASSIKPKTQLGTFPIASAKADVRTVLAGVFGQRFRHGTQIDLNCGRDSKTRIACRPTWSDGPNDYYGEVSTFLQRQKGRVVWIDHYVIHSVNDHCYFHTRHPAGCPVTRHAGTF